jgi:ABC-type cobalamin/Fe3+-siderophores transport system ATPase subunit
MTANSELAVVADGLRLTYSNGARALDGASLSVARGELVAIIGPNGSGKSSLLRALAGLQTLDAGSVTLDGRAMGEWASRERARRVALVPQRLEVVPGYSVEDFVLLGRYAHLTGWRLFSPADREFARKCLEQVDALAFLERGMNEMSGGERQRVLIARALAQEARTILLDEPTSALDLKHQMLVYRLIHAMHREGGSAGRTVVVVTHDLNLPSQFADRIVLMKNGRIVRDGSPREVLTKEILEEVYETPLALGEFEATPSGEARPWVLPRGR